MDLAIKATWGQIALNGVFAIMFVRGMLFSDDPAFYAMFGILVVQTCLFGLVLQALKAPWNWLIVLYGLWCLFAVSSSMSGGLNLQNLLSLVQGVLAAVALYDMTMWFLETRKGEKT